MSAKTILCYGDSNTYGFNPMNGMRYPKDIRWTGILADKLGEDYDVIEEGCNGRTTVFDDPIEGWKNGIDYLKPCLNSHKPVDMVIVMLGSNDLKKTFHASSDDVAQGMEKIIKTIIEFTKDKQEFIPKILLLSPPEIGERIEELSFSGSFDKTAVTRSRELPDKYKEIANKYNCIYIKTSDYIVPSDVDALHLMPEEHAKMAELIYDKIKYIRL